MRYYISDLHFFHGRMNTIMDCRGFPDVESMNNHMIKQWNSRVRKNDEVVILGDVSWGKAEETNKILKQLKGKLYLVKGNHDDNWLRNNKYAEERFGWIKDYAELNDNKRKVVLCHYPIMSYNGQFRKDANGNPITWMLYGHVHKSDDLMSVWAYQDFVKSYPRRSRGKEHHEVAPMQMVNCFCMFSNYIPLTLDEWIELEVSGKLRQLEGEE